MGDAVENETKFLDVGIRNKIYASMFEDLSAVQSRDTLTAPEGLVVSGHADGGVMIRQRGATEELGCIVVAPEQAESLIAAIRRHLDKAK